MSSTPEREQVDALLATIRDALDGLSDLTLLLEARALTAETRLADCEKAWSNETAARLGRVVPPPPPPRHDPERT